MATDFTRPEQTSLELAPPDERAGLGASEISGARRGISRETKRAYGAALDDFLRWYASEPRAGCRQSP